MHDPVGDERFARHLGYPDAAIPEGRPAELAAQVRAWFNEQSQPFAARRFIKIRDITTNEVMLDDGSHLHSERLASMFRQARCHALYVVAVSAGAAVDEEIQRHWKEDRPDEAYMLNAYAAAWTEEHLQSEGAQLCNEADAMGNSLLPHYAPGYDGWEVSDNLVLQALLKCGDLQVLESGQLVPQKSILAVFGVTARTELVQPGGISCERCSLNPCRLRRAPYRDPSAEADCETESLIAPEHELEHTDCTPHYAFPLKALKRWSGKLLEIEDAAERLHARFDFRGSTCSDGGIPLHFRYELELVPENGDYRIEAMRCLPVEGEHGYQSMCAYQSNPTAMLERMEHYRPLLGQYLSEVLRWEPDRNPAGCLCTQDNRDHKWLMVLQTLHYRLAQADA